MPTREFARNHYNQEDIAIFDFTALFKAEHSCLVRERHGHKLVMALVGDGLLEVSSISFCTLYMLYVPKTTTFHVIVHGKLAIYEYTDIPLALFTVLKSCFKILTHYHYPSSWRLNSSLQYFYFHCHFGPCSAHLSCFLVEPYDKIQ